MSLRRVPIFAALVFAFFVAGCWPAPVSHMVPSAESGVVEKQSRCVSSWYAIGFIRPPAPIKLELRADLDRVEAPLVVTARVYFDYRVSGLNPSFKLDPEQILVSWLGGTKAFQAEASSWKRVSVITSIPAEKLRAAPKPSYFDAYEKTLPVPDFAGDRLEVRFPSISFNGTKVDSFPPIEFQRKIDVQMYGINC